VLNVLAALSSAEAEVVVPAPGEGAGFWAGGPSAVVEDGAVWLAYRLRRPVTLGRGYANVVARSEDGRHFTTVAILTSDQFGSASLERPALVRVPGGGWRLYVSCSTAGSKHWWVEAIDAPSVAELPTGRRTVVLPGDRTVAWKDVVVRAEAGSWHMWACRHPLDDGEEQADRMTTWYATSADGLDWTLRGEARRRTGWSAQGWPSGTRRSGSPRLPGLCDRVGDVLRYVTLVAVDGGHRAYFEGSAADGSHDLRNRCRRRGTSTAGPG
jgi:hypothetical protein